MFLGVIHVEGGEQIANLFASDFNMTYQKFKKKSNLHIINEPFKNELISGVSVIEFSFDN